MGKADALKSGVADDRTSDPSFVANGPRSDRSKPRYRKVHRAFAKNWSEKTRIMDITFAMRTSKLQATNSMMDSVEATMPNNATLTNLVARRAVASRLRKLYFRLSEKE